MGCMGDLDEWYLPRGRLGSDGMFRSLCERDDDETRKWSAIVSALGFNPSVIKVRSGNRYYAYEDVAYWDPDKRQGRHMRHCIGRFDGDTLLLVGSMRIDMT